MTTTTTGGFALAILLAGAPAFAAEPMRMASVGSHVSGGVGTEEREEMERTSGQYNLKAIFAVKGHSPFLSGVDVAIKDKSGDEVLTTVTDGPWLFAKLPPGQYTVDASSMGQSQSQRVSVGKGQARIGFYFDPAASDRASSDFKK